eukprot:58516-Chlamydomonas_euryale.AAC.1
MPGFCIPMCRVYILAPMTADRVPPIHFAWSTSWQMVAWRGPLCQFATSSRQAWVWRADWPICTTKDIFTETSK